MDNIIIITLGVICLVAVFVALISNFIRWLRPDKYTPSLGDTVSFIPLDETKLEWGIYVDEFRAIRQKLTHNHRLKKDNHMKMRVYKFLDRKWHPCRCVLIEKQMFV